MNCFITGNDVHVEWIQYDQQDTRANWRHDADVGGGRALSTGSSWYCCPFPNCETGTHSFSCLLMVSAPSPAVNEYTVDDRCVIHMLKGLCLKNQGLLQAAEECFNKVCSRWALAEFQTQASYFLLTVKAVSSESINLVWTNEYQPFIATFFLATLVNTLCFLELVAEEGVLQNLTTFFY